uniref:Gasdermin E n=1 Tax=Catagonus wagneri TaxID=51154 RepID=A0A8C3VJI8_9CETA
MFAKATKNFLREVDTGGNLTAVSNLNDSDKLQLLSLVTKKRRFWCWQKPKYQLLSVTLGDVLAEDQILSPVVTESDFVKYEDRFKSHASGTLEMMLGKATVNIGVTGLVERQSSFGTLRKQEVDLPQLITDARERTINLKHPVLQQVLERKNEVLCVLTQKIVTTQKCVVSEHIHIQKCGGGTIGIQIKTLQVSVMKSGTSSKDSNVVLEVPAPTTIAYGVIELYLRADGRFEFCLPQGKHGGFEQTKKSSSASLEPLSFLEFGFWDTIDGSREASDVDEPLCALKQVTQHLKRNFHPFVELPEQQQTALNDVLQEVLFDEELLMVLERVCDSVVSSRLLPPLAGLGELKPSQQQNLMAFLQLVGCSMQDGVLGPEDLVGNQQLFTTAYFLVSALAEMPDNAAALLGTCCKLQIIPTLCHLLYALPDEGMSDLEDPVLAPLKDTETLEIVQGLFALADINLKILQSSVQVTAAKDPEVFPLILYISLNGLCALGRAY